MAIKLSQLRESKADSKAVREYTRDLSFLLGYEASADTLLSNKRVAQGPFATFEASDMKERVGLVPVLRSGLGLLDGFLNLFPDAPIMHLGIYREKVSHQPVEYYNKLPDHPNVDVCYVLDPVIATGNTAVATINILKEWGLNGSQIKFVAVIGSQQGINQLKEQHPDIQIHIGAVDNVLDNNGYINPGVGDSGDRLWNTKSL
ncbi:uracil phosphoribosyltransferase-domain-containing protein [Pilobolus umbonatus]|nr:uracil phosphoribosyltransferase-domain-containing protein [Pilobolus umbonatus]